MTADNESLFELLQEISEEWDQVQSSPEYIRRDRAVKRIQQANLRILETIYQDRGLKFEGAEWGCVPVQIYGEIDGKRFYFRLRGNKASLSVGPINERLDRAIAVGECNRAKKRLEEHLAVDKCEEKCFTCTMLENFDVWPNNIESYYPQQVTNHSSIRPVGEPCDDYKGDLELDEIVPVFKKLIETLEEVPASEQISIWTLYGLEGKVNKDQRDILLYYSSKELEDEGERLYEKFKDLWVD